ncbi:ABC transporter ATP-binding protein [Streptomyces sp. 11x1]|uniref:ABC transporter ATP-binding protein n=1 Tax=Streptomyces sp. 11x1 TaxID=3038642 RepID=UPI00292E2C52|nr:ABC transporter ATP-binding protein [Streptomyces sp. 11x1]WNZ08459.1 ABC transporter ATP-binding protein [Streptomyces sp. 11x1]
MPTASGVPAASPVPPETDALLWVRDLRIAFGGVEVVRGLSFDVRPREVLALVGESGAGKSLTARALLGMLPVGATSSGTVRLRGDADLAAQRGRRIALVPQDALSALSPVHPVGDQLAAAVRSVARVSRKEARARAVAALDRVGIPDAARRARAYPHEYSGGMRQRAVIAMATINEPDVVVADEPTTALDAELQEQVLRVLAAQREAVGAALVLVTHDLGAVREHADRMLVMYAGRQVEQGPAAAVWDRPLAPYTAGLLASLPPDEADRDGDGEGEGARPAGRRRRRLPSVPGSPPAPDALPPGCAFAPRCPLAEDRCRGEEPQPWPAAAGHEVSCHRWDEVPHPATELFLEPA